VTDFEKKDLVRRWLSSPPSLFVSTCSEWQICNYNSRQEENISTTHRITCTSHILFPKTVCVHSM